MKTRYIVETRIGNRTVYCMMSESAYQSRYWEPETDWSVWVLAAVVVTVVILLP